MAKIAVIGSCSVDLVVEAQRRPAAGETLFGDRFFTACGGKGANQAVAAAKLGAEVYMVGAVGRDANGEMILANMKANGVHTEYVQILPEAATGTAHIILAEGDNSILVVPAANYAVTKEHIDAAAEMLLTADIILFQHEIPRETNEYAMRMLADAGREVLLNPAPAMEVPEDILRSCRYLTPNEHEYAVLFGEKEPPAEMKEKLIITVGAAGVEYYEDGELQRVPAYEVEVVDTTGAGDTFNAAFAVARADGMDMAAALRFANAAAALSVTGKGAQGGMPTRTETEELLQCKESEF